MTQPQQYKCKHCGKTFASQNELQEHEKNCKGQPKVGGQAPEKEKK